MTDYTDDDFAGFVAERRDRRLRALGEVAPSLAPEQVGEASQIARQRGVPTLAVIDDLESIRADEQARALRARSPRVADFVGESPERFAMTRDDHDGLSGLDEAVQNAVDVPWWMDVYRWARGRDAPLSERVSALFDPPRAAISGAVRAAGAGLAGMGEAVDSVERGLVRASGAGENLEFARQVLPFLSQTPGAVAGRGLRGAGEPTVAAGEAIAVPERRANFGTEVAGAVGQIGFSALQSALMPHTVVPHMVGQGAHQGAEEAREAGRYGTAEGDTATLAYGAVTGLSEKLGLDALLHRVPPKIRNRTVQWFADKFLAGAIEGTQEVAEAVGQNVTAQQTIDPDRETLEGAPEQFSVAAVAGAIVRAMVPGRGRADGDQAQGDEILVGAPPETVGAAAEALAGLAPSATDAAKLAELQAAARATKTGDRDPEAVQAFVQAQVDRTPGLPDTVYLNAQAVVEYFQSTGQDPAAAVAEMMGDPMALAEAQAGTGDLAVPLGAFVAGPLRGEHGDALRDIARLAPDRLSNAELQATPMDELLARFAPEDAAPVDPAAVQAEDAETYVRDSVRAQIELTGRHDPSAADRIATSLARQYAVRAERRGRGETARDLLEQYPVRIVDAEPGAAPVDVALDPYIDDVLRHGTEPRSRTDGKTLVQTVIETGGIRPDSPGADDLRSSAGGRAPPGFFNAGGLTVEAMGESLGQQDSGWAHFFPDRDEYDRVTLDSFREILGEALRGEGPRLVQSDSRSAFLGLRDEVADAMRALELRGVDIRNTGRPVLRQMVEEELGRDGATFDQDAEFDQTQTPEFRRWFGDSKVVDANGEPLMVYHGTGAKFDTFNVPAFFSEEEEGARWFATDRGGEVVGAYLQISNPLDVSSREGAAELVALARAAGVSVESDIETQVNGWDFYSEEIARFSSYDGTNPADLIYVPAVREAVIAAGYDGLRLDDPLENGSIPAWVAIRPEQIKIATGNSGADQIRSSEDTRTFYQDALPDAAEVARLRALLAEREATIDALNVELRTDVLTGMRNRRAFEEDASLGWTDVGSFDLDGIKPVNDTFGHSAGDEMLRQAAGVFLAGERDGVRFYRMGGDEFSMRSRDPGVAQALAQEIIDRLESAQVVFNVNGQRIEYDGIGAGYGIAETFDEADERLNADKERRHAAGLRQTRDENGAPRRARRVSDRAAGVDGDRRGAQPADAAQAQGRLTDAPELREWFAGSQVVDAAGEPLRVFHGTRRDFDQLEAGDAPGWGRGIYFTDNREQAAADYGDGEGGRVLEGYVAIRNPWRGGFPGYDAVEGTRAWAEASARWPDSLDAWNEDGSFAGEVLRELGYDGVIAQDSNDVRGLEIVAFEADQVRLVTADEETFFQSQAAPFYSALLRSVEEAKGSPKRGTAAQWKQWLDGAQRRGEFRQAERDWLGLDAWLDEIASIPDDSTEAAAQVYPGGQVSREQMREFVRASELRVDEVLLGPRPGLEGAAFDPAILDNLPVTVGQMGDSWVVSSSSGSFGAYDNQEQAERVAYDYSAGWLRDRRQITLPRLSRGFVVARIEAQDAEGFGLERDDAAVGAWGLFETALGTDETKGDLVSIIGEAPSYARAYHSAVQTAMEMGDGGGPQIVENIGFVGGEQAYAPYRNMVAPGASSNYRVLLLKMPPGDKPFEGGHFEEDTVAHVRFDEREGANGERVLFINELQSDWHQQGRRKGYALPGDADLVRDLEAQLQVAEQERREALLDAEQAPDDGPEFVAALERQADADAQIAALRTEINQVMERMSGVPDAPFKTTWPELVMKRMVRWAAEHGFDRVAWPTEAMVPQVEQWPLTVEQIKADAGHSKRFGAILDRYATELPRVAKAIGKRHGAKVEPIALKGSGQLDSMVPVPEGWESDGSLEPFGAGSDGLVANVDLMINGERQAAQIAVDGEGIHVVWGGGDWSTGIGWDVVDGSTVPPRFSSDAMKTFTSLWNTPPSDEGTLGLWDLLADETPYEILPAPPLAVEVPALEITPALREAAMAGQALFQTKRGSITLGQQEVTIRLGDDTDLSTLHHEFGHLFLNGLMEDAFLEGADVKLAADLDAFLESTGSDVRVRDGQEAVSKAIGREQHEKFAVWYETYLFEGKAPTPALQSLFSRFRAWILSVYGALRARRVPVPEQMRAVYDRLLATDAEIEAASDQAGATPLPDGVRALVGEDRWARYQEQLEAAVDQRRANLQAEILQTERREREAWWKEELDALRTIVADEAMQDRGQRALALLSRGTQPDGSPLELQPGAPVIRPLSHQALVQEFGPEFVKRLSSKRGLTTKREGMLPAMAADLLGFRNTTELAETLANTRPFRQYVEAEALERMRARHPDPLTEDSMPMKALEAVHGNPSLRVLESELAMIADLAGQPVPEPRVLGAMARRIINGKKLRDVRPNDYLVAERKASRDAMAALSKARPQLAIALEAKRRQTMNAHLYRAALEAQETLRKETDYLRRFTKPAKRKRLAKVGRGHLETIDGLLEQIELKQVSGAQVDRRMAMLAYVAEVAARGETITVPPAVLALAQRTNVRDLSVDALRGIADTVRQADHLARRWEKVEGERTARTYEELDEEIGAAVRAGGKISGKDRTGDPTRGEVIRSHLDSMDVARLLPSNVARDLDGYEELGPVFRETVQHVRDAFFGKFRPAWEDYQTRLADLYSAHYSRAELGKLDTPVHREAVGDSWSKARILSLALNWGNVDNRDRILNSVRGRLTVEQVGQLLQTLDSRDWDFVEGAWGLIDSLWPQIRETHRRRSGVIPEKVEAAPFVVTLPDGTQRQIKGGYYPIKYDATRTGVKARKDEVSEYYKAMTTSRFSNAQTKHGHVEARMGGGGRTVDLSLDLMARHLHDVLRDLHLGDPVNHVARVLQGPEFTAAVNATGKVELHSALEVWIRDVATGELPASRGFETVVQLARRNLSLAVLTFKVSTGLLQLTGLVQTTQVIGARNTAWGFWRFKELGPLRVWDYVDGASEFMRQRNGTHIESVQRVANARAGQLKSAHAAAERAGWFMIVKLQRVADVVTWLGAERKGLKEGMTVRQARAYADDVVVRAQAASEFIDKPSIIRGNLGQNTRQSELVKSLVPFMSYMIAKGNVAREKYQRTSFRSPVQSLRFGLDMVILFAVEAMLLDALRNGLPDDDDEDGWVLDDWMWYVAGTIAGDFAATIPIVSLIATEGRGYTAQAPYERVADIAARANTRVFGMLEDKDGDGDPDGIDRAAAKAIIELLGVTVGAPSSQINTTLDAVWDRAEGEDVAPIDYLIKREKPKE